ncbi:MFS transporter [Parasulfuritortus cantonensis]|uniref:MFS transporter n=1 Tax=Parasulfuritortus cantonensis TaxID=2528202 RepID=UPI0023EA5812|nr:MFS transporter [Parasulfuritortus cantonensis]
MSSPDTPNAAVLKLERRAATSLAAIFGLRMLGMFLILPVFALYAKGLTDDHAKIGLALGMYGLTQAILMIPFGMMSDRIGRKPVIMFGLLMFAVGSFVAASATSIETIILGRAIQGAGAISAAVTALLADLTREENRTHAMAMIGGTIGLAFAASLAVGPVIYGWIGVPGMFALTGVLSLAAILVVKFVTPNPGKTAFHSDAEANPAKLKDVLRDGQLLRLNWGIFALHAAQMAMFTVVPFALAQDGLEASRQWLVYLPVVVAAFILMVPAIIVGEKRGKLKQVLVGAIAIMLAAQIGLALSLDFFWGVVAALLFYFIAFNILEASLPSLISKIAPPEAKGTAMGVYNTSQATGLFFGGAAGGWLAQHAGHGTVFLFCAGLMAAWLALAATMRPPPRVKTQMFHVGRLDQLGAQGLAGRLAALAGIVAVTVLPEEGTVMLKVSQTGWDEDGVKQLLESQGGQ